MNAAERKPPFREYGIPERRLQRRRDNKALQRLSVRPGYPDAVSYTHLDVYKRQPERDGGFDRLAMRISRFDEVSSCYLASGGFDLLVLVEGKSMREIEMCIRDRV